MADDRGLHNLAHKEPRSQEATLWPLRRISDYQRPEGGRGYADAIKWANGQHDRATAIRTRVSPAMAPQIREDRKEEFYKRLITKTNQVQEAERERREMYAEGRLVRIVKRTG